MEPEINIESKDDIYSSGYSSLTDVAFFFSIILLIMNFFSYQVNQQVIRQIRMSAAKHSKIMQNEDVVQTVEISIDSDGQIFLGKDKEKVNIANIIAELPSAETYTFCFDRTTDYEVFIKVISACKQKNEFCSIINKVIKEN